VICWVGVTWFTSAIPTFACLQGCSESPSISVWRPVFIASLVKAPQPVYDIPLISISLLVRYGAPLGCIWRKRPQIWRMSANILKARKDDKERFSCLEVGRAAINLPPCKANIRKRRLRLEQTLCNGLNDIVMDFDKGCLGGHWLWDVWHMVGTSSGLLWKW